jgi:hypothetical protein
MLLKMLEIIGIILAAILVLFLAYILVITLLEIWKGFKKEIKGGRDDDNDPEP